MAKITTMIIGLILASLFATLIALFMGGASRAYNIKYDNSSFETYNQLSEIANITQAVKERTENIEQRSGTLDILEGFFSDAYQALKITFRSYGVYEKMSNQAIDDLQLGEAGQYIKIAFTAIVLIIIFVGVLISAIVKLEL